ncbi:TAXI family TRAP transporter solute-binding subunit [Oceanithermus sp.]
MKKSYILAILLGLALSFGASAKTFLTIGSGSMTGVYYPVASGIAKIINENLGSQGIRANARSTGGSAYNVKAIDQGQLQAALAQNDVIYFAYNGLTETFQGKPVKSIRGIATLYPEFLHILARPGSGIHSLADLKGKKVYVGDIGSGVEQTTKRVFEAAGLTFDDLAQAVHGKAGQAIQLLQDGKIDAMFYVVGAKSAAMQQATEIAKAYFIELPIDIIAKLTEKFPYYTQVIIPPNTYKGQNLSVATIGVMATFIVRQDVPEDVVYKIAKLLFQDKVEDFKKIHPALETFFTPDKALNGMTIPLHPGAAKFFKEIGVSIPKLAQPVK